MLKCIRSPSGYISDAGNTSFWNIDYYQRHFDVDTKTVRFLPPNPVSDVSRDLSSHCLGPLSLYQHAQPLLAHIHLRPPEPRARPLRTVLDAHHAHFLPLRDVLSRPLYRLLPILGSSRI